MSRISIWVITAGMTLVLAGCNGDKKQAAPGSPAAGTEAGLLRQIDEKFENPQAHYQLAKIYQADGRSDKARYEYNIAIGFDPVFKLAQAGLVKLLVDTGQADKAADTAGKYVDQASYSAQGLSLLGRAFEGEGLDDYALTCYQKALDIEQKSAALHKQLGYYYLSRGDKMHAEESLRRSFELDPYQADIAGQLGKMGVTVQSPVKLEPARPQETRAPNAAQNQTGGQ